MPVQCQFKNPAMNCIKIYNFVLFYIWCAVIYPCCERIAKRRVARAYQVALSEKPMFF